MKYKLTTILAAAIFSGCAAYQPNFSAISTKNIDTKDLHVDGSMYKGQGRGDDCQYIIIIFPTKLQALLSNAVDEALNSTNATVLLDANVEHNWFYLPGLYGQNCWHVKGQAYDTTK